MPPRRGPPLFTLLPAALLACSGQPEIRSPTGDTPIGDLRVPLVVRTPEELRGWTVTVTLDGEDVTGPSGRQAGGWLWSPDRKYIDVLDLDGVAAGAHHLRVVFDDGQGHRRSASRRIEVDTSGCRLDFRIVDGEGLPRPGRLLVFDADGQPHNLWGPDTRAADPYGRNDTVHVASAPLGSGAVRLPCGSYRVIAAGGVRDDIDDRSLDLDGDTALELVVPRVIDTPGRVAADLHVHTARSGDSFVADGFRYESLVGAGVEVALLSDHDRITEAPLAALGLSDRLLVVHGAEGSLVQEGIGQPDDPERTGYGTTLAHYNFFPLSGAEPLPSHYATSVGRYLERWRDRQVQAPVDGMGDRVLVQLNHPRGIVLRPEWGVGRQYGLHAIAGFSPGTPLDEIDSPWLDGEGDPFDLDVLEVMNRASPGLWKEVRADWFAMMNAGRFPTGTGNSDTHSIEAEWVGFPVNLVDVGADPDEVDEVGFSQAVAAGRVVVANGPVLALEVKSAAGAVAGPGELLDASSGPVTVVATVRAAPWVPVDQLRLVVDGVLRQEVAVDSDEADGDPADDPRPVERGSWTFEVEVSDDSWVLVEAGRALDALDEPEEGLYALLAPDHVPIGFTNPVRLDADGDGLYTAP